MERERAQRQNEPGQKAWDTKKGNATANQNGETTPQTETLETDVSLSLADSLMAVTTLYAGIFMASALL